MDRLIFGMHHLNITQAGTLIDGKGHYSHPNYALDLAGEDAGIDYWYNKEPETCFYCSGSFGSRSTGNTRFFVSCDADGNKKKVLCADGEERVVTIAMTHSLGDYKIYKVYRPGEVMYQEGTAGKATGNHIHLEVAEGSQKTKYWDSKLKVYRMMGEMDPRDAFFILDGYTKVVNGQGLAFKHCDNAKAGNDMDNATKYVEYAKTQIGNTGKKYMDWAGYSDPWCSEFASYCADMCGFIKEGLMPKAGNCQQAHDFYRPKGLLHKKADYAPKPGDIAYFGSNGTDHTAIVEKATDKDITVIEGNAGDSDYTKSKVCRTVYSRSSGWLWGYANPLTEHEKEKEPEKMDIAKKVDEIVPSYFYAGNVPDEGLELKVPANSTLKIVTGHNSTPGLNTEWIARCGGNTAFKIAGTGTMVSVKVKDRNTVVIKCTAGHPGVYIEKLS